jgi:hypothetical protein
MFVTASITVSGLFLVPVMFRLDLRCRSPCKAYLACPTTLRVRRSLVRESLVALFQEGVSRVEQGAHRHSLP